MRAIKILVMGLGASMIMLSACHPANASPGVAKAKYSANVLSPEHVAKIVDVSAFNFVPQELVLQSSPADLSITYDVMLFKSDYEVVPAKVRDVEKLPFRVVWQIKNPPDLDAGDLADELKPRT